MLTKSRPWTNLVATHEHYWIYLDGFPVTQGHLLYVPKDLNDVSIALSAAYNQGNAWLAEGTVDGFNVGMNCGEAAGQTIDWPHVHLIPRMTGDVEDPTGGIRGVISTQQNYHSDDYVKPSNTGQ